MFVRIKHDDIGDLYECGKVHFRSYDGQPRSVLVSMEGVPNIVSVDHIVRKPDAEVYVMNDDGQTIDSYVWPMKHAGKEDAEGRDLYTSDRVEAYISDSGDKQSAERQWHTGVVKKSGPRFVIVFENTTAVASKDLAAMDSENIRLLED